MSNSNNSPYLYDRFGKTQDELLQRVLKATPDQVKVLTGLLSGLESNEIAFELRKKNNPINDEDVKNAIRTLLKNTVCSNRTELAIMAQRVLEAPSEVEATQVAKRKATDLQLTDDQKTQLENTGLTPRQLDVLNRFQDTDEGIALALGVAKATVKAHTKLILKSLGCDNRTQAALYAIRLPKTMPEKHTFPTAESSVRQTIEELLLQTLLRGAEIGMNERALKDAARELANRFNENYALTSIRPPSIKQGQILEHEPASVR